jgi:5-methylcytosine-specific restriction endonuclease McrA
VIRRRKPIRRKRWGRAADPKRAQRQDLLKEADLLWTHVILGRDGRCRRCSGGFGLAPHHIISRSRHSTRHDPQNGMALCRGCHFWVHNHLAAHETEAFYAEYGIDYQGLYRRSRVSAKGKDLALVILDLRMALDTEPPGL